MYASFMLNRARTVRQHRKSLVVTFLVLAFLLYAIRFLDLTSGSTPSGMPHDAYEPRIGAIRMLDGLERAARDYMPDTGHYSRDLSVGLAKVVALHAVHGVSRQSWRENWIANSLDLLGIPDASFAGKMRPEDLAADNILFCSQSSLLLRELFRRNGIEYATVVFNVGGRPPHSALAARPDGVWRYYDPSWEPSEDGVPFASVIAPGTFSRLYAGRDMAPQLEDLARRGRIAIADINGAGPTRGIALQDVTGFVSVYGWLLPLSIALLLLSDPTVVRPLIPNLRRRWSGALPT